MKLEGKIVLAQLLFTASNEGLMTTYLDSGYGNSHEYFVLALVNTNITLLLLYLDSSYLWCESHGLRPQKPHVKVNRLTLAEKSMSHFLVRRKES